MKLRPYAYEPWEMMSRLQRDMERLFGPEGRGDVTEDTSNVATSSWVPPVDIMEREKDFVIHADIPGVDPKDIEITMENGVLSIKGERVVEQKIERQDYKRVERVRGSFYRRFSLPDSADAEKISAAGKNGVLEITIPKRELAQPRKIKVDM